MIFIAGYGSMQNKENRRLNVREAGITPAPGVNDSVAIPTHARNRGSHTGSACMFRQGIPGPPTPVIADGY